MGDNDVHVEAKQAEQTLNAALRAVIQDLPDIQTQLKCRKRRNFGWTLILSAPICLVLAVAPIAGLAPVDHLIWLLFTCICLLGGGWQVDKAAKEEERISRMLRGECDGVPRPPGNRSFFPRRVK